MKDGLIALDNWGSFSLSLHVSLLTHTHTQMTVLILMSTLRSTKLSEKLVSTCLQFTDIWTRTQAPQLSAISHSSQMSEQTHMHNQGMLKVSCSVGNRVSKFGGPTMNYPENVQNTVHGPDLASAQGLCFYYCTCPLPASFLVLEQAASGNSACYVTGHNWLTSRCWWQNWR